MGNVILFASLFRSTSGPDVDFPLVFLWVLAIVFVFFEKRFDLGSVRFIPFLKKCKMTMRKRQSNKWHSATFPGKVPLGCASDTMKHRGANITFLLLRKVLLAAARSRFARCGNGTLATLCFIG